MHKAAAKNNVAGLEKLGGKGVDETNKKGETPLFSAAEADADDAVQWLLAHGADVTKKTKDGDSVAVRAAKNASEGVLQILPTKALLIGDKTGMTALHWACQLGDASLIELLVNKAKELCRSKDVLGCSAIHFCARGVDLSDNVLDTLLEANPIQLEATDSRGLTPLLMAASVGNFDNLELLMKRGANGKATSLAGENLLHLAARIGEVPKLESELFKSLILGVDREGNTPLHAAAMNNEAAVCQTLRNRGANLESRNSSGKTASELLTVAVEAEGAEVAQEMKLEGEIAAASSSSAKLDSEKLKEIVLSRQRMEKAERDAVREAALAMEEEEGEGNDRVAREPSARATLSQPSSVLPWSSEPGTSDVAAQSAKPKPESSNATLYTVLFFLVIAIAIYATQLN